MLKPWITRDILKKCDDRHKILKLVKDETDPTLLLDLRRQDKNLQNVITSEKKEKQTSSLFRKIH